MSKKILMITGDFAEDYYHELIGADYAKEHIFNDTQWSEELKQFVANSTNTLEQIEAKSFEYYKQIISIIDSIVEIQNKDDKDKEELILHARVGARKLWAYMYEYANKLEIIK